MSDLAIRVHNLSKRYRIGAPQERYRTLRENLADAIGAPLRRFARLVPGRSSTADPTIWALKDISFEVQHGQVLGIIGRNGAGKSTLLKILSRITKPTTGYAEIHGRVGSLLEVGTGFHPELTGRENVYLNGAILGMKKAEIERKFDEIVAFAGIEEFIDTPVKRYSSGMYVRLAFAVAAHLEPEILLVDEVLAVGDAAFQKKCLGKMGDVAKEGRTVLFVSHNMVPVLSLCSEACLLDAGVVVCRGDANDVVETYMRDNLAASSLPLDQRTDRDGDGRVRLKSISLDGGIRDSTVRCTQRLSIRIAYEAQQGLSGAAFLVGIYDQFGRPIFFLDSSVAGGLPDVLPRCGTVTCATGPINVTPGPCIVNVAVRLADAIADHIAQASTLQIEVDDFYGTGRMTDRRNAICLLQQHWKVEQ